MDRPPALYPTAYREPILPGEPSSDPEAVRQRTFYGGEFLSKYENELKVLKEFREHITTETKEMQDKSRGFFKKISENEREICKLETRLKDMPEMERTIIQISSKLDKITSKIGRLELVLLRMLHDKEYVSAQNLSVESQRRIDAHKVQRESMRQKVLNIKNEDVQRVEGLRESCKGTPWEEVFNMILKLKPSSFDVEKARATIDAAIKKASATVPVLAGSNEPKTNTIDLDEKNKSQTKSA